MRFLMDQADCLKRVKLYLMEKLMSPAWKKELIFSRSNLEMSPNIV
jgi:hypothetical protein